MKYQGWISYWVTDNEITDLKFEDITIFEFETLYGEIDPTSIITIKVDIFI